MYWNTINNGCYEFTKKFYYAPDVVYMNRDTYSKTEQELYGEQWWHLVKHNRVRGLHVMVDESVKGFRIIGKEGDSLELEVE